MYSELQCLQVCATCELLPTDAGWKSQIVFYLGTRARLSSRCYPLDYRRAESLGGRINRGREACRTCPDDSYVVEHLGIGQFRDAQLICQVRNRRTSHDPSVPEYDCWQ